ncbi:MAG: erythromycin esterase family protein [Planctomycetes bacterium]|nr:erythromycin esterase family protein [Planctomycetota bacterium]
MLTFALFVVVCASDPTPDRRVEWVRANASPIRAIEPLAGDAVDDFADLRPLQALIGDATIVGLGEATHGTREFTTLRRRIVRYLATECGFDVLALEGNFAEGERLFELVRGAPGSLNDATRDLAFWCWTTRELEAVFEDARARTASGAPLDVVGIDMQLPRASIDHVLGFLATHDVALEARVRALYATAQQSAIQHGTVCCALPIDAMGGATLRISAWLRTEDVGAGDVQLFARADGPSGFLARGTMEPEFAGGSRPFTQVSVLIGLPDPTTRVQFGVILRGGRGKVWIDDIGVEADGRAMPLPFDASFEPGVEPGVEPVVESASAPPSAPAADVPTSSLAAWSSALAGRTPSARHAFAIDDRVARSGTHSLCVSAIDGAEPPTPEQARDAATTALKAIEVGLSTTTEAAAARALRHARVVVQGFTWAADETRASREVAMADNLAWWREQLGPGTKVIVWAHNGHIARSPDALGDVLARRFGSDYVAIAPTTGRGRYRAEAPLGIDVFDLATPPRASIEATLLRSGASACLLDLRRARTDAAAAWLLEERPFRFIGTEGTDDQFQPMVLPDAFDGVLWIADTTPTTPLGAGP